MLKRFKNWLKDSRDFLFSWYTTDSTETQEPERSLVELPQSIKQKLVNEVENIPSSPSDKDAIASTLDRTFELWRKDPENANNSVVILSSPIMAVSRILSETLEEWAQQKQLTLKLLPLNARPQAIETIELKLEHYLKQKSAADDHSQPQPELVVIPNLSWCFLRSLEGLEGIEYLQSLLCEGSNQRFWVIGGGQVGWEYLNSVCAIEAYCGEVVSLPAIAPEDLAAWIEPIIDKLKITFDKPSLETQILDREKDHKTNYFKRLADISEGVSTVAIQVFLKSISYQEIESESESESEFNDNVVVAQTPKLPKLPSLESADRYLLYSLLLHGDLTVSALSVSLGDSEAEVQARVQTLRRQGVVEQRNNVLKINPIHYPKLKRELASNNFIINRD